MPRSPTRQPARRPPGAKPGDRIRARRLRALLPLGTLALALGLAGQPTIADASEPWRNPLRCDRSFESGTDWLQSDASLDLYNGIAYLGIAGPLSLAGEAFQRWSAVNELDGNTRSALRLDTVGARRDADLASDAMLGISLAALPAFSILAHQSRTGDCIESYDMLTDFVESLGLTLLITESVKLASGRARPFTRACGPGPPRDASCSGDDPFRSFISGHASLAATGAGLTCAFSIKREAWGSSRAARAMPCGLGIATALAAGTLRIASDRHWLTDVAIGLLVGGSIGYFDTWGPFDWMKFERRDAQGRTAMRGVLMPSRIEGGYGARLVMVF